jgi:hypothetical protein
MKRRITLVSTIDRLRDWNTGLRAQSHIVFASSFKILCYALEDALSKYGHDVERVVIDRAANPADYLELLAHISPKFAGDIVFVLEGEKGYLSAIGRGGDRVLYPLDHEDLRFYLETQGLIAMTSVAAA